MCACVYVHVIFNYKINIYTLNKFWKRSYHFWSIMHSNVTADADGWQL